MSACSFSTENHDGYQCITVEDDGAVTTVTMNRPDQRNALGQRHLDELLDAFTGAGRFGVDRHRPGRSGSGVLGRPRPGRDGGGRRRSG